MPADMISFHAIPGPAGIEEAERRLRAEGFEQVTRSADGHHLQVAGSRVLLERLLGLSLVERRRRAGLGPGERDVVDLSLPEGAAVPDALRDAVAEIVFPLAPDYYQATQQRQRGF